ncbi:hsp90 co-chaperone Cdc37-like [Styela clava]|nr:hsp90 co-chaperone Cdc37-like isoform X2 [Styela clava]
MARLDYSKWDHIEVSDDEDDTHPNIDTPSLFRWRHQARVDRMEERKKEREKLDEEKNKIEEMRKKLMQQTLKEADKKEAESKFAELKKQEEKWKKKEEELAKKEKSEPWNIDTICKEGFSKSMISKPKKESEENLNEEEQMQRQKAYAKKYEKDLKTYGMMSKIDDIQKYLQNHPYLVCDKAANFLVIWCIDLEVEEKHALMETVAHQTIILQFILELAKTLKQDPRNCFVSFFEKFKRADESYNTGFYDELAAFKLRVKDRAQIRIQKAMEEIEREEREKRIGPGGLDPQEVFETLPKEMQDCFEKRDIPMLQKIIASLEPEQAKYHMKRCVDSGLWVPGGGGAGDEQDDADDAEEAKKEEEVYETVD